MFWRGGGWGNGIDGILSDNLSEGCLTGDATTFQNCSTDEMRPLALIGIAR
ncbi:MAG TPA: hypothetical protein VFK47_06070 [Ktedonobacteraceae bacterium]|nr:hypothetical protein [Ktedonobacteraceae bacterium]